MFDLVWRGEVIDSFDSEHEAREMAREYASAYKGPVSVRRRWSVDCVEVGLFAENDGALYAAQFAPIARRHAAFKRAGTYDSALALRDWTRAAKIALAAYSREHGPVTWNRETAGELAEWLADSYSETVDRFARESA
jgi:hypothetical protein